jgi:uncharacterized protein YoxC
MSETSSIIPWVVCLVAITWIVMYMVVHHTGKRIDDWRDHLNKRIDSVNDRIDDLRTEFNERIDNRIDHPIIKP